MVGVSGGADSMALLHVLGRIARGASAFLIRGPLGSWPPGGRPCGGILCSEASRHLGLPFISQKGGVREKQEQQRVTLQEAAREVRYSFLLETARISPGHKNRPRTHGRRPGGVHPHAPPAGLRDPRTGGNPSRAWPSYCPSALESWREEVESFLRERKVGFLTDPSNRSLHFLRNRVRHELLPILQQYNPRLSRTLVQMGEILRAEEDFWQSLVKEKFPKLVKSQNRISITLDIPSLKAQPLALRLRSLRHAVEKILGNLRGVGLAHILAMDQLLSHPEPNQCLQLPQGLFLTKAYQDLNLAQSREEISSFEVPVSGSGRLEIPEIGRANEVRDPHFPLCRQGARAA